MSDDRIAAAIGYQRKLADEVETAHASRLMALYRGEHDLVDEITKQPKVLTHRDITGILYPNLNPDQLKHYRRAVSIALPRLFSDEEYANLTARARSAKAQRNIAKDPEAHRAKLGKAREATMWGDDEVLYLFEQMAKPEYQTPSGRVRFASIAPGLEEVANCQRSPRNLSSFVNNARTRDADYERAKRVLETAGKEDLLYLLERKK